MNIPIRDSHTLLSESLAKTTIERNILTALLSELIGIN